MEHARFEADEEGSRVRWCEHGSDSMVHLLFQQDLHYGGRDELTVPVLVDKNQGASGLSFICIISSLTARNPDGENHGQRD